MLFRFLCLLSLFFLFPNEIESKKIRYYRKPKIGDVCYLKDNTPYFIRSKDYSDTIISDMILFGVVYGIEDKMGYIVNVDKRQPSTWSSALRFIIRDIDVPAESGDYRISFFKETATPIFKYNKKTGKPDEFSNQLNDWFIINNCKGWSSYTESNTSFVLYYGRFGDSTGYDFKINNNSLQRCLGSELKINNTYYCYNLIGQSKWACGMNRKRMEEHCRYNTSKACAPSENSMVDGINSLYDILPYSEENFMKSVALQKVFSCYDDYLDACMIDSSVRNDDPLQYRNGKLFTEILAKVSIPLSRTREPLYPAANIANCYRPLGIPKDNQICWWLPSMYELSLLLMNIDIINNTLIKNKNWVVIEQSDFFWSSCPQSSYYAWLYHTSGMSDCNSMGWADNNGKLFVKTIPVTIVQF